MGASIETMIDTIMDYAKQDSDSYHYILNNIGGAVFFTKEISLHLQANKHKLGENFNMGEGEIEKMAKDVLELKNPTFEEIITSISNGKPTQELLEVVLLDMLYNKLNDDTLDEDIVYDLYMDSLKRINA